MLRARVADIRLMEYQVVTTFNPGGRLHQTEQFTRRQGCEALLSPPEPPRRRHVTPRAGPPTLTAVSTLDYGAAPATATAAAASSPAASGAPAMTVAQQGPPQIRFPRTLRTVGELYQLWRYGFPMMPSVDELEKRWGSRWRLRNERQLFSMRKVVIDEVVKLAGARGWPEEDTVRGVEKQRVAGGDLSLDLLQSR